MTNAVSGINAALFASDPNAEPTAFTDQELVDSGDHKNYQIAYGSRDWDEGETLTIEKQTEGVGDFEAITSGFTINYLEGKITFASEQDPDDNFQASGSRMVQVEVADAYNMEVMVDGRMSKDVSSFQKAFSEYIPLKSQWSARAKKWFVNPAYAEYLLQGSLRLKAKFFYTYSTGGDQKALAGFCRMNRYTWGNPNDDVVTEDWELQGDSKYGLFWEDNP